MGREREREREREYLGDKKTNMQDTVGLAKSVPSIYVFVMEKIYIE